MRILIYSVACLIIYIGGIGSNINSKPYSGYYEIEDNVEEYFVEHAVSTVQARNSVQEIDFNSVQPKAGCKECSRQEIRYCTGLQLMNDHCCCDKKYSEYFPYVPHTCYIGEKLCEPYAKDCAEYTRLRTCCCDKLVLSKWKMLLSNGPKIFDNVNLIIYLITMAYFLR